jgi:hypothetical protein
MDSIKQTITFQMKQNHPQLTIVVVMQFCDGSFGETRRGTSTVEIVSDCLPHHLYVSTYDGCFIIDIPLW